MQNLHQTFDWQYIGQIIGGEFAKFCGLLRLYELYQILNFELRILRNICYCLSLAPLNTFKAEKKSFLGQRFFVWLIRNFFSQLKKKEEIFRYICT